MRFVNNTIFYLSINTDKWQIGFTKTGLHYLRFRPCHSFVRDPTIALSIGTTCCQKTYIYFIWLQGLLLFPWAMIHAEGRRCQSFRDHDYGQRNQRQSGVQRSQSFQCGMNPHGSLPHGYLSSSNTSLSTPILGETYRGRHSPIMSNRKSSAGSLGFSFRSKAFKIPKVPRPTRTLIMFASLKRGLR